MVGGIITEVVKTDAKRVWVNVCGTKGEYRETCGLYLDPADADLKPGDKLWWQSGKCYWTDRDLKVVEKPLVKLSASGTLRPRRPV